MVGWRKWRKCGVKYPKLYGFKPSRRGTLGFPHKRKKNQIKRIGYSNASWCEAKHIG